MKTLTLPSPALDRVIRFDRARYVENISTLAAISQRGGEIGLFERSEKNGA